MSSIFHFSKRISSSSIDLDQPCYRYIVDNPGETKIHANYTITEEGGVKLTKVRSSKELGKMIARGAHNQILEEEPGQIVQIPYDFDKQAPRYEGNLYKSMEKFTHSNMIDAAYKFKTGIEFMSDSDTDDIRKDFLEFLKEKRQDSKTMTDVNQWKFWTLRTLIENNLRYKLSSWYRDGKVNKAIRDVQPKSCGCILILSSKVTNSHGPDVRDYVQYKFGITMDKYEGNLLNLFENMKKMNGGSRTKQQKSAIIIQKAVRKFMWRQQSTKWATSRKSFPSATKIFEDIKNLYKVLADNGMFCSDVKPENIVYKAKGSEITLKLIDIDAEPNSCEQEWCIVDNPNKEEKNVYLELMLLLFFAKILQDVNVDNQSVQPFFNQLFQRVIPFIRDNKEGVIVPTFREDQQICDEIKLHLDKISRPFLSLYDKNQCFQKFISTMVPHYHTNIGEEGLARAGKYQKEAQKFITKYWDTIVHQSSPVSEKNNKILKDYYAPLILCIYCKVNTRKRIIRKRTKSLTYQRKLTHQTHKTHRKPEHSRSTNKSRRAKSI